jgi:branched-chain amino acid transport system substrate-binding protein
MNVRHRRALALVLLSSAFLSACGLKPEVKEQLAQNPGVSRGAGGFVDGGEGGGDEAFVDPETGEVIDPGTVGEDGEGAVDATGGGPEAGGDAGSGGGGTGGDAGSGSGGSTGGSGGGSTGGTGGGGTGGGGGGAGAPGDDGDTTGVDFDKKTVKITLHGPLTGAGVPQSSFRSGTPKYWENRKLKNGFTVLAEAVDDKYNAPDALRACNAAARDSFLIVGGAGTDQIQACAQSQVLRRNNVPYLSSGVTESGLGNLPNYFATSLTYRQQGALIPQLAKDNGFLDGTWAVVITEGPNFADARESVVAALQKAGVNGKSGKFNKSNDVYLTGKAPTNCSTLAGQMRNTYDRIYFLGQPSFFINCVTSIGYTPTYQPIYTGVGPSFGIQSVGRLACSNTAGQYKGFFLHPSPGLDTAAKRAPGVQFQDDIEYGIYGAMQQLEQAFNAVPGKLTREKFIATSRNGSFPGGILSPAVFKGQVFGGTAAFGLRADCNDQGRMKTLKTYAK